MCHSDDRREEKSAALTLCAKNHRWDSSLRSERHVGLVVHKYQLLCRNDINR